MLIMKIKEFLPVVLIVSMVTLWVYLLNANQEFFFYYREQQQIFIYDYSSFCDRYFSFGGLSLLLSQFLVQFFCLHWTGPIITAVLGGITTWLIWHSLYRLYPETRGIYLVPFCFMPVILQLNALSDFYYNYDGFVAFVLMIVSFALYTWITEQRTVLWRVIIGSLFSLILYFLAGPVAIPFSVSILFYDLLMKRKSAFWQIISVGLILITGFLCIHLGIIVNTRFAFTNDFYYEPLLKPRFGLLMSWIAFVILPPVLWITHLLRKLRTATWIIISSLLLIFDVGYSVYLLSSSKDSKFNVFFRLQRDVVIGNWNDILREYDAIQDRRNYLLMNYVNLALSYKGKLIENLFYYRQQDPFSLMVGGNARRIPEVITLLSYIYYRIGNISAAQDKAFDSFVSYRYGNPSMLKMLIKTNLIYRNYAVAEKYISILEKTWYYRKWAIKQRCFLYNDKAVAHDREFGSKQRDLPRNDHFTMKDDPYEDLKDILQANSYNKVACNYTIAYLLLLKNKNQIDDFVQRYYRTPVLYHVPELFQQALVAFHENDLSFCLQHGVTKNTIRQYQIFKSLYIEARNAGQDPRSLLDADFSRSYWYYFLFNIF